MSSSWTHAICELCWTVKHPGRLPHRVRGAVPETCCYCGATTDMGIFLRADPETVRCHGQHDHTEEMPTSTPPKDDT